MLSLAWFACVIWLISRALGQRRALSALVPAEHSGTLARICFLVPARNEEANIERCIRSLLAQDYPRERLSIVVVDDASSDGTAEIVRGVMAGDDRLRLMSARPLPAGWTGKVNACWVGVRGLPPEVEWICFLDADMWAAPALARAAVAAAIGGKIDLLSLTPKHTLGSFAERLMIPCGFYLLAFSQDLAKAQAADSADAVATGQFMLARRRAYDAVGGHAAVRAAICEDVELARLMKRRRYRVLLMDGSRLLNTRMYTGWGTLWPGIAKNLSEMLGGPARTVTIALLALAMAAASVLLPALGLAGCAGGSAASCVALVPALLGSMAAFALHIAGAIHFAIPFWYGFLFPVGYAVGAVLAFDSLRWRASRRIRWKGRVYQ